MKKLLALLVASAFIMPVMAEDKPAAEKVKVCVDVQGKDGKPVKNKDGSVKQDCKMVKKHVKHEGTKVEDAKKK